MPRKPANNDLSKLDKFGLWSGIFGLLVNLGTFLGWLGFGKSNINVGYATAIILIFYTTIISGFYARRLLFITNKKELTAVGKNLEIADFSRIEHAASLVTCGIAASLCLAFIFNTQQIRYYNLRKEYDDKLSQLNAKYEKTTEGKDKDKELYSSLLTKDYQRKEEIEKLEMERQNDYFLSLGLFSLLLLVSGTGLTAGSNYVSNAIYKGCDPKYLG